jgi:hypothetical protein
VHQFTSNAKTIHRYTVKTIKNLKSCKYDVSSTGFGFSQNILREHPELVKPNVAFRSSGCSLRMVCKNQNMSEYLIF